MLDPFAGSGTTGMVARQQGRHFVGIELSESYCRMAMERMRQSILPLHVAQVASPDEIT
ncbi:MAG: site-specific DNA-methyltransferase [Thermomicrobia bacterium]|nr:site-specific DNA-methyltransferase [Thermomicrobia bacterium]